MLSYSRSRGKTSASVEIYAGQAQGVIHIAHPQLLDGAWSANAPRLTQLVADYGLIGDLAATYGRIEELRWRLRQRTATVSVMAGSQIAAEVAEILERISAPLVTELQGEVEDLLKRVTSQIAEPRVQELGLLHVVSGTVGLELTVGGSTSGETSRADT